MRMQPLVCEFIFTFCGCDWCGPNSFSLCCLCFPFRFVDTVSGAFVVTVARSFCNSFSEMMLGAMLVDMSSGNPELATKFQTMAMGLRFHQHTKITTTTTTTTIHQHNTHANERHITHQNGVSSFPGHVTRDSSLPL